MYAIVGWLREGLSRFDGLLAEAEFRLGPDNYDMPPDEIRELVLKECVRGEQFYPGDLATKHGLDYERLLSVLDGMRQDGLIKDV